MEIRIKIFCITYDCLLRTTNQNLTEVTVKIEGSVIEAETKTAVIVTVIEIEIEKEKETAIEKVVTANAKRIVNEKRNARRKESERRNEKEIASVADGREKNVIAKTGMFASGIENAVASGRKAEHRVVLAVRDRERTTMKITNVND